VCPVFALHRTFSPEDVARVDATCRTGELGCVDCKTLLGDHLVDSFSGFRDRRAQLASTPGLAAEVLAEGAAKARPVARATLEAVRDAMHFGR
jgi:tryptophanyl-tRNA synthetase